LFYQTRVFHGRYGGICQESAQSGSGGCFLRGFFGLEGLYNGLVFHILGVGLGRILWVGGINERESTFRVWLAVLIEGVRIKS
jgi:hypothetical protein